MSGLTDEETEKAEIEAQNLFYLLEKYGIDLDSERKWFQLAIAMARGKVKGFSDDLLKYKKTGRPSKQKNALANLARLGALKKTKKRGAPKKPKFDPEWVDKIKADHNLSERGADKKALEIAAAEYCKPAEWKSEVQYLQKRLSEARKIARDNSKK